MDPTNLNKDELQRYSRQIILPQVGTQGQQKLKDAKVLCVGAGGLGTPLLLYLAAAGVGTLGIMDDETIELSNLQRQILYTTQTVGKNKALIAKEKILDLNPEINVHAYVERLTHNNAETIFTEYDLIADCSDNFPTRYLINDIAFALNKPLITAAIAQTEGFCVLLNDFNNACFRCLFPESNTPVLNCSEGGVLGVLAGILGTMQAGEIIKFILNKEKNNFLFKFDLMQMSLTKLNLKKDPECQLCNNELDEPLKHQTEVLSLTPRDVKNILHEIVLIDVRTEEERVEFHIGGQHIPLQELPFNLNQLEPNAFNVIYCHSDIRSAYAAEYLKNAGFKKIGFLKGGVVAWQQEFSKAEMEGLKVLHEN